MRILQLCNKPPFPTVDGGTIAMHALTQGLLDAGHTVKVIAIETPKHPFKYSAATEHYVKQTQFEPVKVDTTISPLAMLKDFLTGQLYILNRFISNDVEKAVIRALQQEKYDCVLLESLYVAPYINVIRQYSSAKIILRAHNVEHLLWQREFDKTQNPLRLLYLRQMIRLMARYEKQVFTKVNGVAAISAVDAKIITELAPAAKLDVIPLSTNYTPVEGVTPEANTVFHLGAMDWFPNIDGINWLLDYIWPVVLKIKPDAKLYLAGRNMPDSVFTYADNAITVEGAVDNPVAFMSTKNIMVVPLFLGSGVRVKIIEGMALGKAIVATPLAVEGLAVSHKKNIYIAGNEQQFAAAIVDLLNNPQLAEQIGRNAAEYIDNNHRPGVVIQKLEQLIARV